ncbi:MAG TPA: VOC family protein [Chloroflexia bacterium]|nr:VOC family protein [Chloroflexia bacterium]
MQKITPSLWFDNTAEEAVNFYISVFKKARITTITRYGKEGPGQEGVVRTIAFEIDGQEFLAINGGPEYKFTPAISFAVNCESQNEVDELWEKLSEGGAKDRCGWLVDKYGMSWQIVPEVLMQYMNDPDPVKQERVMSAVLQMDKLDIKTLQQAYAGS